MSWHVHSLVVHVRNSLHMCFLPSCFTPPMTKHGGRSFPTSEHCSASANSHRFKLPTARAETDAAGRATLGEQMQTQSPPDSESVTQSFTKWMHLTEITPKRGPPRASEWLCRFRVCVSYTQTWRGLRLLQVAPSFLHHSETPWPERRQNGVEVSDSSKRRWEPGVWRSGNEVETLVSSRLVWVREDRSSISANVL